MRPKMSVSHQPFVISSGATPATQRIAKITEAV